MIYVVAAAILLALSPIFVKQPRPWIAGFYILAVPILAAFGAFEVYGTPKPTEFEWRDVQKTPLLGYHVKGKAMYLWLETHPPRVYELPYSDDLAGMLNIALNKQARDGTMIIVNGLDTESSDDLFHNEPVPPDPAKSE